MAIAHIVITKEIDYQGGDERFSNGYTLDLGGAAADEGNVGTLVTALIDMEQAIHASDVRFVYANGGPRGANSTYVNEFTTVEVGAQTSGYDHPEVCVLAESKFGQRRYARKWFHLCRGLGVARGAASALAAAVRTAINTQLVKLTNGTLPLSAHYWTPKAGTLTVPFTCDEFLRTHQFRARPKRKLPPQTP
jgi:hypothetical protein